MTAVPNWDIMGPAETDAELARAAAAGDRGAFAGIYDRYADRLHDFCVGMLRDRDGAADCVQDVFCTAATRLSQLREPDKLRPWLYAIARNEALRRLRERRRETPSDEVPETVSHEPGPDTLAARTELADLIAEAAGGLSDRDRSLLELTYRQGLDGSDLAEALGVTPTNATKMVYRLRETIERSLGALLVSRRVRNTGGGCPELAAVLDGWDGEFSVLMRKRIARHIESCAICDEERHRLVSPVALLGATPVFIPAPAWLRERTLGEIELTASATAIEADAADFDTESTAAGQPPALPVDLVDDVRGRRTRRWMLVIALLAAIVVASLGLTIAWQIQKNTVIAPTDLTGTAPQPISTAPSAAPSPTPSNPLPAPPTVPSTTPIASVPPGAGTPSGQTPAYIPPPLTLEPSPPQSGPSNPATPTASESPVPRTRPSSSMPTGLLPPLTSRAHHPTATTPTRRANKPSPKPPSPKPPTRRSIGSQDPPR